jgi:hypothetical protein
MNIENFLIDFYIQRILKLIFFSKTMVEIVKLLRKKSLLPNKKNKNYAF